MNKFSFSFLFPVVLLFLCSCAQKQQQKADNLQEGTPLSLNYATGFSISFFDNYKQVVVNNPWIKGEEYARYYLVEDESTQVPNDGKKVKIPLISLASASATHIEFLRLLGELETLTGVCLPYTVYNETVRAKIAKGEITDLGDAFKINVEQTLHLNPSALMMSGYNQSDANAQRIAQAGIPVIYNNEWTETTLLGRAEWIKFVAAFYDKEQLADSIFNQVETAYNDMKGKAKNIGEKSSVMSGSNFRGTWYMPAGKSFMGELFADAGCEYAYANDTTSGSLPLNFEKVLVDFSETDIWLNCNFNTMDELLKADKKHNLFRPVKRNKVYNFNKRMLPSGANDFWESAVARPDLLLADVIAIAHPQLLPDHELVYANQLK